MIDTSLLDNRRKFYIGLEIGNSLIAKPIQFQTHKIADEPLENTASHVFILVNENNTWMVYESHAKSNGVTKYPASEYKTTGKLQLFPFKFSMERLNFYCDFKYPYGYWDIFSKVLNLKNDGNGLICSEYAVLCDLKYKICRYFNIKPNMITPAHIQRYLKDNNINCDIEIKM